MLADLAVRPRRLKSNPSDPTILLAYAGMDLAIHSRGATSAGRRALLLHGWEADHHDMITIAEDLATAGFFCVLPDLPAHGASGGDIMTIPDGAGAVLEIERAYGPFELCVAHSLGAAVALYALDRGAKFTRLTALTPPANYIRGLSQSARAGGAPEPLITAAIDVLRRKIPDLDRLNAASFLPRISIPGLIFIAGKDETVSPDDGREWAKAWPSAKLVELPEATHRSILRDQTVPTEIRDFVESTEIVSPNSPLPASRCAPPHA